MTQFLLETPRTVGESHIANNPLSGTILPDRIVTEAIKKVLRNIVSHFTLALEDQGCSIEMIRSVEFHVDFDLQRPNPKYTDVRPWV